MTIVDLTVDVVVGAGGFRVAAELVSSGSDAVEIKSSADSVDESTLTMCSAGVGRGRGNFVVESAAAAATVDTVGG